MIIFRKNAINLFNKYILSYPLLLDTILGIEKISIASVDILVRLKDKKQINNMISDDTKNEQLNRERKHAVARMMEGTLLEIRVDGELPSAAICAGTCRS